MKHLIRKIRTDPQIALETFMAIAAAVLILLTLTGCQNMGEDLAWWKNTHAEASSAHQATTQAIDAIDVELMALPPDDPLRGKYEKNREKLLENARKYDEVLRTADKAIAALEVAIENRDFNDPSIREAVKDIPYGSLVVGLFGVGLAVWKKIEADRTKRKAEQVVRSVDVAFPNKTPEQKLALAASQDEATQQFVAKVTASAPPIVKVSEHVNGANGGSK